MDDRQSISKFAIFAAYVAAGSLVSSEILQAILMRRGDPSLLQALRALEAPRAEHTDPELPQQPGSLWAPAMAVSTATAATEYAFTRPTK